MKTVGLEIKEKKDKEPELEIKEKKDKAPEKETNKPEKEK